MHLSPDQIAYAIRTHVKAMFHPNKKIRDKCTAEISIHKAYNSLHEDIQKSLEFDRQTEDVYVGIYARLLDDGLNKKDTKYDIIKKGSAQ